MRQEIEAQEHQLSLDSTGLRQLGQSVRSFANQTDGLLLLMMERDAPETRLEEVEDLFDFFHAVEDRIEALLARTRGQVSARGPA